METIVPVIIEKLKTMMEERLPAEPYPNVPAAAAEFVALLRNLAVFFVQVLVAHISDIFAADVSARNALNVTRKDEGRTRTIVMDEIGPARFISDNYMDRDTGKCETLPNLIMGFIPGQRIEERLRARLVAGATRHSYRETAEITGNGDVSHQSVSNCVRKREAPEYVSVPSEKKQAKELYVMFDEDHCHMQPDAEGNRKKCQMVPFGVVCEGREKVCENRHRLLGRHMVVSETFDTGEVVERAAAYILTTYDVFSIEHIYVMGDGASWITTALDDWFPGQVVHIHDAYHYFKQAGTVSRLFPRSKVPERVRKAVKANDLTAFESIVDGLTKKATGDAKKLEKLEAFRSYYLNHWNAIVASYDPNIMGCCTEPLVQHLLSDRLSTRPMGWSEEGLGKAVVWRAHSLNGVDICSPDPHPVPKGYYKTILDEYDNASVSDWSVFAPIPYAFDGNSGTGHRLRQLNQGGCLMS